MLTQTPHRLNLRHGEDRARIALQLLSEAQQFARELRRNPWEFAVDIQSFRAVGVPATTLRWLVCTHHVEHAIECTRPKSRRRVFRHTRNYAFTDRSCFVLKEIGNGDITNALTRVQISTDCFGRIIASLDNRVRKHQKQGIGVVRRNTPRWDSARRELRLGRRTIKHFRVPAHDQELVLAAFEELQWPTRMDDPLPPNGHRNPKSRLHDTIKRLNQHQNHRLIRFSGDGTGRGICWELIGKHLHHIGP